MSIYQNIKNRRIQLGLSQEEFAEKLGYTDRSSISKIENGVNDISISTLTSIASVLQTSPAELLDEGAFQSKNSAKKPFNIDMVNFNVDLFCQNIEILLAANNVSKADFYTATGISSATFSQWKTGQYTPSKKKIQAVLEFFDADSLQEMYESPLILESASSNSALSTIIKQQRAALGLTLAQIADLMNVSEATVQRWESGNIKAIRHNKVKKLAAILQVSPSVLLGISDSESSPPPYNSVAIVRSICKERNIPISRLEQDLGFSNGYISQLRKGMFPADRLIAISKYLNVPLEALLLDQYDQNKDAPDVSANHFLPAAPVDIKNEAIDICNHIRGYDKLSKEDAMELYALVRMALSLDYK